eukprot:1701006-Amphidinium_carterae.2
MEKQNDDAIGDLEACSRNRTSSPELALAGKGRTAEGHNHEHQGRDGTVAVIPGHTRYRD